MKNTGIILEGELLQRDKKLATAALCVFTGVFGYGAAVGYVIGVFGKIVLALIMPAVSYLLWLIGYGTVRLFSRLTKYTKPEYDPTDPDKIYHRKKHRRVGVVFSLVSFVLMFLVAYLIRDFYYDFVQHETRPHSTGYVYEVIVGIYGYAVTLSSVILNFLPDELYLPIDSIIISLGMMVIMAFVPTVYMAVHIFVSAGYLAAFLIITAIRYLRYRKYVKRIEKLEKEEKEREFMKGRRDW